MPKVKKTNAMRILDQKKLMHFHRDMHNLSGLCGFNILLCSHVFEHSVAPYILMTEFNSYASLLIS